MSFQLNALSVRGTSKTHPALGGGLGGSVCLQGTGGRLGCGGEPGGIGQRGGSGSCSPGWLPLPVLYVSARTHKALLFTAEKLPGEHRTVSPPYGIGKRACCLSHPREHAGGRPERPADRRGEGYRKSPLPSGCPLARSRGPLRRREGWEVMGDPTGREFRYSRWHIRGQR